MGYLSLTRIEGEEICLTIDPAVDTGALLRNMLREGITVRVREVQSGRARVYIEAPKQMGIFRSELMEAASAE